MKTESSLRAPGQMALTNKNGRNNTKFNIQNKTATDAQQATNGRATVLDVLHCMFLPMHFNGKK